MPLKYKSKKLLLIITVLISLTAAFIVWQNNSIVISEFNYVSDKLPISFNNFKILQVSDLHNKQFGNNQSRIIKKIEECSPDIIIITGDLIDRRKFDLETAMEFVEHLPQIAPVYYVSGNHEAWSGQYDEIKSRLLKTGITVLDNESISYLIDEDAINIIGIKDPDFLTREYWQGTDITEADAYLSAKAQNNDFNILLSHRPELMDLYKKHQVNLVFAGHAHGGQIRLPICGGLFSPDQGFFPKYDAGRYEEEGTTMFVSRGLGNSILPLRIFNRPELVVVTLKNSLCVYTH